MSGLVPWAKREVSYPSPFASLVPYRQDDNVPTTVPPPSLRDWWKEMREQSIEPASPVRSAVAHYWHLLTPTLVVLIWAAAFLLIGWGPLFSMH